MNSLLAMIGLWLSFNLSLPAPAEPPKIEFVSKQEILFRRYRAFTTQVQNEVLAAFEQATRAQIAGSQSPYTMTPATQSTCLRDGPAPIPQTCRYSCTRWCITRNATAACDMNVRRNARGSLMKHRTAGYGCSENACSKNLALMNSLSR